MPRSSGGVHKRLSLFNRNLLKNRIKGFDVELSDVEGYPSIRAYLERFKDRLEPRPTGWKGAWPGRKAGAYKWCEIQDSVDYYPAFEKKKLFWPDIAKLPRFSLDDSGAYLSNTGYILTIDAPWILAVLQSRAIWFCISQIATPLRLRGGLWQYRCVNQFMERLPIPDAPDGDKEILAGLATRATDIANKRYKLHESTRRRIRTDLGNGVGKLNLKLSSWWEIDFADFRAQVKKAFKIDIPLKERSEWEDAIEEWRGLHDNFTHELIEVETEINERVYKLYSLSRSEVQLIEEHMKKAMLYYPFGSV